MHLRDFVRQHGTAQMQVQRRQRVGSSMVGGLSDEYHRGGVGLLRVFAKDSLCLTMESTWGRRKCNKENWMGINISAAKMMSRLMPAGYPSKQTGRTGGGGQTAGYLN